MTLLCAFVKWLGIFFNFSIKKLANIVAYYRIFETIFQHLAHFLPTSIRTHRVVIHVSTFVHDIGPVQESMSKILHINYFR